MNSSQRHFAEEFGLFFERVGLPRIAGRVMGWLLICDPPRQTAQQLAEALHASAGSISNVTRTLESLGYVTRAAVPGSRRRHYAATSSWSNTMRNRIGWISAYRELVDRGLDEVKPLTRGAASRLREMRDLYAFMEEEIPKLLQRWETGRYPSRKKR